MDFKKKLAVVLSAATVLMSAVPALGVSGAAAGYIKGDIDGDGKVGASDIVAVSNYITGKGELTEEQLIIADMNDDGVVNVFDQMLIRRTVLEIRDVVEVPEVTDPTEPTTEETEPTTEAPTEAPTEAETTLATDPTEPATDVTEEVTTEATEVVTTIVTEEVTTVATDVTEEVTTEATEVVTTIVTEEVTTAGTTVVTTAGTEAVTTIVTEEVTTEGTEVVTTIATEEVTTVDTDVTEEVTTEGTTVVTTAGTIVVTTIETEPVTTVVTTTEEAVTYAFPYEANIDPENTGSVDGIKFAVSADEGVVYNGAVQFFVGGENFDVEYSSADAADGVVTVNTPAAITDPTAVTMIKICKYWQSDDEASVVLTDVKVIIDGEETAPYVEPAKTADSAAVMMGMLGSNQFWSVDDLAEGSVIPTVTENGTYTAKLVLNQATGSVEFLIIGLDGLKAEDFAGLAITVDEILVDGDVLATADLSKAKVEPYAGDGFDGTRIYLTDTWTGTMAAAVPADTAISSSIEVTFTVSGIND